MTETETETETAVSEDMTLRLRGGGIGPEGRRLGLCAGDVLLAVNGVPFRGDAALLAKRIGERAGKPVVLTLQRGDVAFPVLVASAKLGAWDAVPALVQAEAAEPPARIDPDGMRMFVVMRAEAGGYDLFPAEVPVLAMVAAPVWLLQMRVWIPGCTLVAALAAAAVVTPWLALAVWIAAGLWVRRAGLAFLRADRLGRGLAFNGMIAARSEGAAHELHRQMQPGDRCLFCPQGATPDALQEA